MVVKNASDIPLRSIGRRDEEPKASRIDDRRKRKAQPNESEGRNRTCAMSSGFHDTSSLPRSRPVRSIRLFGVQDSFKEQ